MSIETFSNDCDLLLNISRGNEEAFRQLFITKKDKVYSYAYHFTHLSSSAEDITQEVFFKIWVKRESLVEIQNFDSWLATVTRNLCFDFLKKKALELKIQSGISTNKLQVEENVDEYISYKDQLSRIDEAVNHLSPQQQQIFKLKKRIGMKNEEIAKYLHISPNTVRAHMVVILKKIRQYLNTHSIDTTLIIYFISKFF
jgi:RNA polymerase sigma-70 factor (family 1)